MDLSIIIPVYNAEAFLSRCAESIKKSDRLKIQCILVNDGSKDSSKDICENIAKKDERFHVVNKGNGGVSSARNTGLEYAEGKYIMFLDADDFLTEQALKLIEDYIKGDTQMDFAAFSHMTLFADGRKKQEAFEIAGDESKDFEEAKTLMYASSQFNACWGKLFRKELIAAYHVRFPEELSIGEDFVFVAEYFKHCKSSYISQQPVLYYRQHGESAMRKYTLKERLEYTQTLYDYNKSAVMEIKDDMLLQKMYNYYIRVLTNLFLEFSKRSKVFELSREYRKAFQLECVREFVTEAKLSQMKSYKKVECFMLKKRMFKLLAFYFKLKSCL